MSHVESKVGEDVAAFTAWLYRAYITTRRTEKDPYQACVHVMKAYMHGIADLVARQKNEWALAQARHTGTVAPTNASNSLDTNAASPETSQHLVGSASTCDPSAQSTRSTDPDDMSDDANEKGHDAMEELEYAVAGSLSATDPTDRLTLQREMKELAVESKMQVCRTHFMAPYQEKHAKDLRESIINMFVTQFVRFNRRGERTGICHTGPEVPEDSMLGCKHYARNCKLFAECCKIYVPCRLCHDEMVLGDHEMNRYTTKEVLCTVCMEEQPVGKICRRCGVEFARYFCDICKFYENTPGKYVYHCPRCEICRRGRGLDIDNYHCNICDACVSLESKAHHKCMNRSLHACCPVCCEYLFTSTKAVVFMRCGHTMHSQCFDEYTKTSYQCPYCYKSLTNMSNYFAQLDEMLKTETMPPEFSKRRAYIFCNDCEERSVSKYHYIYIKCAKPGCGSYNTRLLRYFEQTESLHDLEEDKEGDEESNCTGQGRGPIASSVGSASTVQESGPGDSSESRTPATEDGDPATDT